MPRMKWRWVRRSKAPSPSSQLSSSRNSSTRSANSGVGPRGVARGDGSGVESAASSGLAVAAQDALVVAIRRNGGLLPP
eukprot:5732346-Lingulodinium_polyedra.AAC.1